MNVGELKKSLSRFPPDMNDSEVFIMLNGWATVSLLAFTGTVTVNEKVYLVLGSPEATKTLNLQNKPT